MTNYIKSELYRNLRSKGNCFFILGISACVVFLNVVLSIFAKNDPTFKYGTTGFAFSSLYYSLHFVMYMSLCAVSGVFGQEYKNKTLKNTISFGISRSNIYFVKLIVSIIFSIITSIIVLSTFIGSAYLLLENSGIEPLITLFKAMAGALPIIFFALIVAHCFYFIMEKEMTACIWWGSIVIVIPEIIHLIGKRNELVRNISSYIPWNMVGSEGFNDGIILWLTPEGLTKTIIVGIIGCVIFYVIGLKLFNRKEIK